VQALRFGPPPWASGVVYSISPSNPGWWAVAAQPTLRRELRETGRWFRWPLKFVTRAPAALLLCSLFLASASAQDAAKADSDQRPATRPIDLSQGAAAATKKSTKISKYDVQRIGQRGIGEGINEYSLEEERDLGRELSEQVEMRAKLITDPVITGYVDRLGQTIVLNSDALVPFTIKVAESDEISALALPGGYLYVNSGLILAAESEAELAGLIAHEVAHVAARHATRAETRMKIFTVLSVALTYFGGPAAAALQLAVGVAGPATFMKFGRDAEREADLLGLEYAYVAGYDPQAFVQFFERLHIKERHNHNFIAKAFATHPMTEDRVRRAQEEISILLPGKNQYIVDTSAFQEMRFRLADLMHEHAPSENGRPVLHRRTRENDMAP
jgi:predicted Zn-dependent protease